MAKLSKTLQFSATIVSMIPGFVVRIWQIFLQRTTGMFCQRMLSEIWEVLIEVIAKQNKNINTWELCYILG